MKMVYKIVAVIMSFFFIHALNVPTVNAAVNSQCATLETMRQKVQTDLQFKVNPLSQLRIKNSYANTQVPGVLKTKITAAQTKGDKERAEIFKKLQSKALTAEHKSAVDTYKTEYETALQSLRASQNNAQKVYVDAYSSLFSVHRSTVDSQITILKTKIDASYNDAKAQCAKVGIDKTLPQLKSNIILAQDTYNQAPNLNKESIQTSLQSITEDYKTSTDKAEVAFDEALQLSEGKLKTALYGVKYIFE